MQSCERRKTSGHSIKAKKGYAALSPVFEKNCLTLLAPETTTRSESDNRSLVGPTSEVTLNASLKKHYITIRN